MSYLKKFLTSSQNACMVRKKVKGVWWGCARHHPFNYYNFLHSCSISFLLYVKPTISAIHNLIEYAPLHPPFYFVCHTYNYGLRCIGDAFKNIVQEISILLVRKRSLKKSSRGFLTISCKIKLKKFLFSFKMIVTCQNLIEEHHRLRNESSTD